MKQGKTARADTITIRVSPKLNYFLELSARKQHRTKSNFVECAIEKFVKSDGIWQEELWHPFEPERLALLKSTLPHLLTYNEELKFLEDK